MKTVSFAVQATGLPAAIDLADAEPEPVGLYVLGTSSKSSRLNRR